jgi:hypothetical protein
VNGTEWLAFEPERAMVFARPREGPNSPGGSGGPGGPDGPDGPGGPPPGEGRDNEDDEHRSEREELRRRHAHDSNEKHFSPPPVEELYENSAGYLHTYAAVQDLRLLYIDGMSAAKTQKGTLDSQDVLLFINGTVDDSVGRGLAGEGDRARKACGMAEDDWAGRIDGVLRMEAGFEIILCNFERDLLPVRITKVKKSGLRCA